MAEVSITVPSKPVSGVFALSETGPAPWLGLACILDVGGRVPARKGCQEVPRETLFTT